MGSDGQFGKKKIGMSLPPRKWTSSLLSDELSLETLQDTTYVRLLHSNHVMSICDADVFEHDVKGTRGGTAWSWLKRPVSWNGSKETGSTTSPVGLAKSKSHNAWGWLGRQPAEEFQFDPSKRWPQGW